MVKRPSSVTAADVARELGVSRSTVSRAFTPSAYVKPQTRDRVLKAAEALGYQPNALARALISQRSRIVGIIMGDIGANPIHAAIHSAATREIHAAGLIPLTAQIGGGATLADAVATFRQHQASAVLLTSMNIPEGAVALCRAAGLKTALLNRIDPAGEASAVCADVEQGGAAAARLLARTGRRRVAVITGPPGAWTTGARRAGHLRGLSEAGLAAVAEIGGDYTYAAGVRAADRLFGPGGPRPDAVLAANDLTALGLLDAVRAKGGLSTPEDVAIIGFDDIEMAGWTGASLTTVRLPVKAMVAEATRVLAEMVFDDADPRDARMIDCALVQRATTPPDPAAEVSTPSAAPTP